MHGHNYTTIRKALIGWVDMKKNQAVLSLVYWLKISVSLVEMWVIGDSNTQTDKSMHLNHILISTSYS